MDYGWTLLIVVVAANALVTFALVREVREVVRRPARPSKKFFALIRGEPIVPKHGRPTTWTFADDADIAKSAKTLLGVIHRAQRAFFHDFVEFADVVNAWFGLLNLPWRLEELADNELQLFSPYDPPPEYGRRYSIWHGQAEVGMLEMKHANGYSSEKPVVLAAVEIGSVRLIRLGTLRALLEVIATHVTDYKREGREQTEARARIDHAIQEVLWDMQHVSEFPPELNETSWGELKCEFFGSAFSYFAKRNGN
jgi:hypothetical protein